MRTPSCSPLFLQPSITSEVGLNIRDKYLFVGKTIVLTGVFFGGTLDLEGPLGLKGIYH